MQSEITNRQAYAKGLSILMNLIDKTQIEVAGRVGLAQPTISRALDGQASEATMKIIAERLGWNPVDLVQIGLGALVNQSDPYDYTAIVRILARLDPDFLEEACDPAELLKIPGQDEILESLNELQADIFNFVTANPKRNVGWVLTELDFLKRKIRKMTLRPWEDDLILNEEKTC